MKIERIQKLINDFFFLFRPRVPPPIFIFYHLVILICSLYKRRMPQMKKLHQACERPPDFKKLKEEWEDLKKWEEVRSVLEVCQTVEAVIFFRGWRGRFFDRSLSSFF